MKQTYEKAKAKVVLFDNSDVITTSGGYGSLEEDINSAGNCKTPGQDRGNSCKDTSGVCPGRAWKEK